MCLHCVYKAHNSPYTLNLQKPVFEFFNELKLDVFPQKGLLSRYPLRLILSQDRFGNIGYWIAPQGLCSGFIVIGPVKLNPPLGLGIGKEKNYPTGPPSYFEFI